MSIYILRSVSKWKNAETDEKDDDRLRLRQVILSGSWDSNVFLTDLEPTIGLQTWELLYRYTFHLLPLKNEQNRTKHYKPSVELKCILEYWILKMVYREHYLHQSNCPTCCVFRFHRRCWRLKLPSAPERSVKMSATEVKLFGKWYLICNQLLFPKWSKARFTGEIDGNKTYWL